MLSPKKFQDYFVLNQIKSLEKAKSSGHFVQAASMLHPAHNREENEVGHNRNIRADIIIIIITINNNNIIIIIIIIIITIISKCSI